MYYIYFIIKELRIDNFLYIFEKVKIIQLNNIQVHLEVPILVGITPTNADFTLALCTIQRPRRFRMVRTLIFRSSESSPINIWRVIINVILYTPSNGFLCAKFSLSIALLVLTPDAYMRATYDNLGKKTDL